MCLLVNGVKIMLIIGLTGNIASGKTTVSNILKALGAVIIDADIIAREILLPHTEGWQEVVSSFGQDILTEDNQINRAKLGSIVFEDQSALAQLNKITHPLIIQRVQECLNHLANNSDAPALVVIDAALLIETNLHRLVDEVWLVKVERDEQIKRLMYRNKLSETEAQKRIKSQISWEEKAPFATEIIDNNGKVEDMISRVKDLWSEKVNKDNNQ